MGRPNHRDIHISHILMEKFPQQFAVWRRFTQKQVGMQHMMHGARSFSLLLPSIYATLMSTIYDLWRSSPHTTTKFASHKYRAYKLDV